MDFWNFGFFFGKKHFLRAQENTSLPESELIGTWESFKFSKSREFGSEHKYRFGWDLLQGSLTSLFCFLARPNETRCAAPRRIASAGWTATRLKAHLKWTMIPTVRSCSLHLLRAPLIWTLQENLGPNYHAECMLGCSTCADGRKARARRCRKWKTDGAKRRTWRDVACGK